MIKHILFDYDGVLVDSFNFHLDKYNEIFKFGLGEKELQDAHNGNFYENKSSKLKQIDIQDYVDGVKDSQQSLPLRSGVEKTLSELAATLQLHLVTSGWEQQILPNLEYHDIAQHFTHLMFADHGHAKHDKINDILHAVSAEPEEALFVTDTLGDVFEAKQVPIQTIALTCGFQPRETIEKGEPEYMVDSWTELDSLLKELCKNQ